MAAKVAVANSSDLSNVVHCFSIIPFRLGNPAPLAAHQTNGAISMIEVPSHHLPRVIDAISIRKAIILS